MPGRVLRCTAMRDVSITGVTTGLDAVGTSETYRKQNGTKAGRRMMPDRDGKQDAGHKTDAPSGLPEEARSQIGRKLKQVYGDLLAEPLPDRFSKLLDELAKTERKS